MKSEKQPQHKPAIVIVDDEPLFLDIVQRRVARQAEWDVIGFENPLEALAYLQNNVVDVVISDIYMVEMDGIDFLEKVHKLNTDTVLILMTSGKDRNKTIEAVNRLDLYFFYDKESRWEDMLVVLRNAIEKRALTLSLQQRFNELEQANQQLKAIQNDLLQQKKRAVIGELIQGTCHNINTPLGVIVGNAELIRYQLQPQSASLSPASLLDRVDAIQEAAERIQDITYNLMLKSKMDQSPQQQEFSLNTLVERELKFLQANAFLRLRVHVELQLHTSMPKVLLNYGDMSQVFGNILRNALDAISEEEEPKLLFVTGVSEPFVFLEIHDNGPGVPEELYSRIFDPFFTTKDKQAPASAYSPQQSSNDGQAKGGMGLGLYSVTKLLEPYQGAVKVDNSPLGGACFRICLPLPDNGKPPHANQGEEKANSTTLPP